MLRDIRADDVQSEISKESSRSASAAAEVERARAVTVLPNEGGQVTKREIVRSRKLKRRIRAGSTFNRLCASMLWTMPQ